MISYAIKLRNSCNLLVLAQRLLLELRHKMAKILKGLVIQNNCSIDKLLSFMETALSIEEIEEYRSNGGGQYQHQRLGTFKAH